MVFVYPRFTKEGREDHQHLCFSTYLPFVTPQCFFRDIQGAALKSLSGCEGFRHKLRGWGQVAFELGLGKVCERLGS